jgi:alkyl hydroperoxide reductase subunit D
MNFENILTAIPDYAKDIKLNLSSLANNHTPLSEQQFAGSVLVASIASKNTILSKHIHNAIGDQLTAEETAAAHAAATIMAMTNIYYRFQDLVSDPSYSTMPAGLRMNILRAPGVAAIDFETWSLVASIINGCHKCVTAHEQQLIKHGITKETIQLLAKIAAVIHSLATVQLIEASK